MWRTVRRFTKEDVTTKNLSDHRNPDLFIGFRTDSTGRTRKGDGGPGLWTRNEYPVVKTQGGRKDEGSCSTFVPLHPALYVGFC